MASLGFFVFFFKEIQSMALHTILGIGLAMIYAYF